MKKFTTTILAMTFLAGMVYNMNLFASTHTVQVGNYYFNPSTLDVNVGDIIEWVWVTGSHTTTSTSVPSGAASWDEPINSGNQTYSYTVTTAGTYNYVCTPHASMGMVGSFVATNPAPYLNVTPSNQNVTSSSGSTTFSVSSNTNWNASSDKSWCSVTASGSGNGTIIATYSANSTTDSRIAYITVSGTGVSNQVVTVTQAGAAATLQVSPSSRVVTESAGSTDFTVTSNSSWTAASDVTWCTVTVSGSGNGTIVATYEKNTAPNERTASITVSVSGLSPVVVQVLQDGSTVGIQESASAILHIFPNPAKDFIKVTFDNSPDETIRVSLVDLQGKIVFDRTSPPSSDITLNIADLERGPYFIKISMKSETITRKVILVN